MRVIVRGRGSLKYKDLNGSWVLQTNQSKNMVYLSLDAGVSIVAASLLSAYFGSRVETDGHGDFALSWSGSTVNIGLNTNPVLDGVQPSFMKVFTVRVWYWG